MATFAQTFFVGVRRTREKIWPHTLAPSTAIPDTQSSSPTDPEIAILQAPDKVEVKEPVDLMIVVDKKKKNRKQKKARDETNATTPKKEKKRVVVASEPKAKRPRLKKEPSAKPPKKPKEVAVASSSPSSLHPTLHPIATHVQQHTLPGYSFFVAHLSTQYMPLIELAQESILCFHTQYPDSEEAAASSSSSTSFIDLYQWMISSNPQWKCANPNCLARSLLKKDYPPFLFPNEWTMHASGEEEVDALHYRWCIVDYLVLWTSYISCVGPHQGGKVAGLSTHHLPPPYLRLPACEREFFDVRLCTKKLPVLNDGVVWGGGGGEDECKEPYNLVDLFFAFGERERNRTLKHIRSWVHRWKHGYGVLPTETLAVLEYLDLLHDLDWSLFVYLILVFHCPDLYMHTAARTPQWQAMQSWIYYHLVCLLEPPGRGWKSGVDDAVCDQTTWSRIQASPHSHPRPASIRHVVLLIRDYLIRNALLRGTLFKLSQAYRS